MKLNPYLKEFWKTRAPIKVLYGGRVSSKSYDTAGILLYLASKYKVRILCIRRYQNKITQSVYAILKELITSDDYLSSIYTILKTSIVCNTTGSEFIFYGLHNAIDEVVGLQGINISWIEEAHTLKEIEWNLLRPTLLRNGKGSFCVLVFNPRLKTDFVYKNFVLGNRSDTLVKKINYINNPFLEDEAIDLIEVDKIELEEDDFNHIYLGYPKAEESDVFIKGTWIEACIDAHKKLNIEVVGKNYIGYDIADDGDDKCATCYSKGILLLNIDQWQAKTDELEKSAERVYNQALKTNSSISYDCIGVGASAGSTFKRLNKDTGNKIRYNKFRAGDAVDKPNQYYKDKIKNKDHFDNLKSQAWQNIADRMLVTYNAIKKGYEYDADDIISISSKVKYLDDLIIELSSPKTDVSNRGLVSVESKVKMSKRGIKSPNIADAFIMCFYKQKNYSMRDML